MVKSGEIYPIKAAIDVHTHLREPGTNKSETIASGTRAALAGGYQAVFDMPNNPGRPTWTEERITEKQQIARRDSHVDIGFYAGVDLANPDIDQIPRMISKAAGLKLYMGATTGNAAVYTLDEARPVIDFWIEEAKMCGYYAPIVIHAENEIGADTARYIFDKEHHVHWAHLSTAYEAEHARRFTKLHGEYFTSEATPHHLTMNEINADQYGWPAGRMMPSLKKEHDREAVARAFADGDIQILGTDHAPHDMVAKLRAQEENPHGHTDEGCTTCFGISGIEFALPVMMREVMLGRLTMERLQDAVYDQPLRMLGISAARLTAVTELETGWWQIGEDSLQGGSTNTPYINQMAGAKVARVKHRHIYPQIFEAQRKAA